MFLKTFWQKSSALFNKSKNLISYNYPKKVQGHSLHRIFPSISSFFEHLILIQWYIKWSIDFPKHFPHLSHVSWDKTPLWCVSICSSKLKNGTGTSKYEQRWQFQWVVSFFKSWIWPPFIWWLFFPSLLFRLPFSNLSSFSEKKKIDNLFSLYLRNWPLLSISVVL